MFENDVSRREDIGLLLVASGGTLMVIAAAMAAILAFVGPRTGYLLANLV